MNCRVTDCTEQADPVFCLEHFDALPIGLQLRITLPPKRTYTHSDRIRATARHALAVADAVEWLETRDVGQPVDKRKGA